MIKFWKSAAKGKTGCPVRPPEQRIDICSVSTSNLLSKEDDDYAEDQVSDLFVRKSSLNLSLEDILLQEKALKYFMQFMNVIGQNVLLKSWLELENFKTVANNNVTHDKDQKMKISRTKSFEHQTESHTLDKNKSHRLSWRDNSNVFINSNIAKQSKMECLGNSCITLTEHPGLLRSCDICREKGCNDLTELAISLFKKYIALEAPQKIDLPDDVRKIVISNICHPEGKVDVKCFVPVQEYLVDKMNKFYSEFQKSPLYVKAQIDVLTSGNINLKDVLYNESILFYFTEYLEQESCSLLLQFLISVMHYRDNMTSDHPPSREQAQADAIVLYDKYFSLQATNPIGFSADVRAKIETDICDEKGPLPTCFDLPYKIVYKTVDSYIKTFLESEIYYKYLSEMIHSVDQRWTSNSKSHSDCSSEFSISTQNTLLAMGDPVYHSKKRNNSVPDMTIDSNQLYNADALWQRKRQDGLSLGRINSLGRFESKFEPDPDKKDRSVFKKMVNKFVPNSNSKVDEEMAWQIAHMIVKDVTDLTMAPPDNDHE